MVETYSNGEFTEIVDSMLHSIFTNGKKTISLDDFVVWVAENVPGLTKPIKIMVYLLFLADINTHTKYKAWLPIALKMKDSVLYNKGLHWALTYIIDSNIPTMTLLYSSYKDGNSMTTFCHNGLGYKGPTFLLVEDNENHIFGAYMSHEWTISQTFIGSEDCLIFSLIPNLCVYRTIASEQNYVYIFKDAHSISRLPVGIGFGGDIKHFRLWIDGDFNYGTYQENVKKNTYKPGPLISPKFFIKTIELWGCKADPQQQIEQKLLNVQNSRQLNR